MDVKSIITTNSSFQCATLKKTFDRFCMNINNLLKDTVDKNGNFPKVGRRPKFSNIQVIALFLTSEALSIYSENNLFMKLNTEYKKKFQI